MKRLLALAPAALLLTACYGDPPPPPPITPAPPGGVYRALGTEPFWDLTIDQREIVFTDRGTSLRVVQPTPPVIGGFAGEIYQTPRIGVNIVHRQCSDGMSDRVYPDTVQVDVDGRRYNGCGGAAVMPTLLAGTNWRVVAVNGRPTPQGEFFINFEAARLAARFGCNHLGGPYSQNGNSLTVGPLVGTRMACSPPIGAFENEGSAILRGPVQIESSGGDTIQLTSSAGTLALRRSY